MPSYVFGCSHDIYVTNFYRSVYHFHIFTYYLYQGCDLRASDEFNMCLFTHIQLWHYSHNWGCKWDNGSGGEP